MSFLCAVPAFVTSNAAAGLAAATLAVAGSDAVTATVVTGSTNPSDWGKAVTAAVTTCGDRSKVLITPRTADAAGRRLK